MSDLNFEEVVKLVTTCPGVVSAMLYHCYLMTDDRGPKEGGQDFILYTKRRWQFRVVVWGKFRAPKQFADSTMPTLRAAVKDAFERAHLEMSPELQQYVEGSAKEN